MTKRIDPALLTPVSGEITLVTDAAAAAKPKDGMVTSSTTAMLSTACTASRRRSTWSIVTRCSRARPMSGLGEDPVPACRPQLSYVTRA